MDREEFWLLRNKKWVFNALLTPILLCLSINAIDAQKIDTSSKRVITDVNISLPSIGKLKQRSTNEIASSNWIIGCETLDRDFTDYDQYKEYIVPLGIKLLRMQAGWTKTEKVKGRYDWAWLDHIIDDATSRGFKPWLQTSYGNKLYPGGGGDNLGAGMPTSKEALEGYNKWVAAMVTRYKDKVKDWEIWNEPNFGDNTVNTPEITADFNIRTAEIIKRIQPEARISGLALGHFNYEFVDGFLKYIAKKGRAKLFDNFTYHDYVYNPDANYYQVYLLQTLLEKYTPGVQLRQGENGAPSGSGSGRGALWDYEWSELTQAKWDIRRMLGNLGHGIECSIFGLIEMAYTNGPINKLNYKGIIKSDSTKKVIRPKMAYYAIQNVTSIFDDQLERIKGLEFTHNINGVNPEDNKYTTNTDRSISVYGFRNKQTQKQLYTIWMDDHIPAESNKTNSMEFIFSNANFSDPVLVDMITGTVYEIPENKWSKKGNVYTFKDIPIYDAPIVIADKSTIHFKQIKSNSNSFLYDKELPWDDLGGGVQRQVVGYNKDLMIVKFKFQKGGLGAPHHHVHSQSAVVLSGVFELTIDGKKKILKAGDGYMVEPNVVHSALCLEDGILVDAFNPTRDEFLLSH